MELPAGRRAGRRSRLARQLARTGALQRVALTAMQLRGGRVPVEETGERRPERKKLNVFSPFAKQSTGHSLFPDGEHFIG